MANHASALKRHRQSLKRNARNRSARATLATQVKKAKTELGANKGSSNLSEVKKAVALLASSARKGLLHKKAAARRISRLMKQANRVGA